MRQKLLSGIRTKSKLEMRVFNPNPTFGNVSFRNVPEEDRLQKVQLLHMEVEKQEGITCVGGLTDALRVQSHAA